MTRVCTHRPVAVCRASRDLGCRTLGELLDMDVPRPVDLNCNRLCPALMPGAVTGKRFGLTCLCCPVYGECVRPQLSSCVLVYGECSWPVVFLSMVNVVVKLCSCLW